MNVAMKEFRLAPLSLRYMMILFIKYNSTNKNFFCSVRVTSELSGASNNPIIM
jgi:hypothetical protein